MLDAAFWVLGTVMDAAAWCCDGGGNSVWWGGAVPPRVLLPCPPYSIPAALTALLLPQTAPSPSACRVDGGIPLREALAQHDAWLRQQGLLGGGRTFVPVTWRDW
jgi:hypothetical protein